MSVKFFGQFLIEQGEIDVVQLRQALGRMDERNRSLGQIAVEAGLLANAQADEINLAQRETDRPFGELAVELGHLSEAQMQEILEVQQRTRVQVGETLVDLGMIEDSRLPQLLDDFKADQAPYELKGRTLPAELGDNPIAPLVLELMPKFCMRIARLQVKTGFGQPLSKLPSFEFNVGVKLDGPPNLQVTLVADQAFASKLAAATAGLDLESLDDDFVRDGLGEFLNVLCGNVVAALEREGTCVELGPPVSDAPLTDGLAFELAVGEGQASLVLAVP